MEVGQGEENKKPTPIPTTEWQGILHEPIVATGLFPQSIFAQGIMLANSIAEASQRTHIPIATFLEQDPPEDLLTDMFMRAKKRGHKAYNIPNRYEKPVLKNTWEIEPTGGLKGSWKVEVAEDVQKAKKDLLSVWEAEKVNALQVLESMARFTYDEKHGEISPFGKNRLQEETINDPLFRGLLRGAAHSFAVKEVKDFSNAYKGLASDFIKRCKQDPLPFATREEYELERQAVLIRQTTIVTELAPLIKDEMIKTFSPAHPALQQRIEEENPSRLFGNIGIDTIDPLGHGRFQWN